MDYVILSGGFDPVHMGHVAMFNDASQYGRVIVCLNSDEWLARKKGKPFMSFNERLYILKNFNCVDRVVDFDDTDGTACDGIKHVHGITKFTNPQAKIYFANGGDRTDDNTPEQALCDELGIDMLWGVGGGKAQSSSDLLRDFGKLSLKYETRPWGSFEVLLKEEGYQVKRLTIAPAHGISIQYHNHRSEHWVVASGNALVNLGETWSALGPGESIDVAKKAIHGITNNSDEEDLVVIEVQMGDYLEEDDIIRLKDRYNR